VSTAAGESRPPARSVGRAATGMGITIAVSRVFGFVRVLVIAAVLGTTYLGNAFQSANLVSNVLFELIAAGALSAVLVPTFARLFDAGEQFEVERLSGALLGLAAVVLGSLSICGILLAPWLSELLTLGVPAGPVHDAQVELTTFLLRFFVPQVLLYAFGAIAIAVLNARREFVVPAAAPIANTVVMVGFLGLFSIAAGAAPGLDLALGPRLLLAAAGTLGVFAYVAVPVIALWRDGVRPRIHVPRRDPKVVQVLRLSGWATVLHMGTGLLLGGALVVGNGVAGGSVAYNVAFVFFLAPFAVFAQPVMTAILPELANEVTTLDTYARSMRWALDTVAIWIVPISALIVALAHPTMEVVSFGEATDGVGLLAAGLASLAVGLFTYSAFLLLARGFYAFDNSRIPALTSLSTAVAGVIAMVVAAPFTEGAARVAALGFAHSGAMTLAAIVLFIALWRRVGHSLVPAALLRSAGFGLPIAVLAWAAMRAIDPDGRVATLLTLAIVSAVAAALYLAAVRFSGGFPKRVLATGAST